MPKMAFSKGWQREHQFMMKFGIYVDILRGFFSPPRLPPVGLCRLFEAFSLQDRRVPIPATPWDGWIPIVSPERQKITELEDACTSLRCTIPLLILRRKMCGKTSLSSSCLWALWILSLDSSFQNKTLTYENSLYCPPYPGKVMKLFILNECMWDWEPLFFPYKPRSML